MLKKILKIMLIILVVIIFNEVNVQANSIEYRGEAEGLIAMPNDFFLNLGELMPGDVKKDFAYIKNTTNDEVEVYFKTEPLNRDEYYDDIDFSLLEKISLKISLKKDSKSKEKVLYEGNLGADLMNEYVSLGKYTKGYNGEFLFQIEVPKKLKNSYTLSTAKVKWVFFVEKKGDKKNSNQLENDNKENSNQLEKDNKENNNQLEMNNKENNDQLEMNNKQNQIIENVINAIKTGDSIYYAVGIFVISILLILIIKKKSKSGVKK